MPLLFYIQTRHADISSQVLLPLSDWPILKKLGVKKAPLVAIREHDTESSKKVLVSPSVPFESDHS